MIVGHLVVLAALGGLIATLVTCIELLPATAVAASRPRINPTLILSFSRDIVFDTPFASLIAVVDAAPAPGDCPDSREVTARVASAARATGTAAVRCRSAARPMAVFQPCGTNRMLCS